MNENDEVLQTLIEDHDSIVTTIEENEGLDLYEMGADTERVWRLLPDAWD